MHDITELEKRGIPALFIASEEFQTAAAVQAEALGFNPAHIFVPHPIQGQRKDQIEAIADLAFTEILRELTSAGGG